MNEQVRKLTGEEILEWLRAGDSVTYRYRVANKVMLAIFAVGAIFLSVAVFLAMKNGLYELGPRIVFFALVAISIWFWLKLRWAVFAVSNYVGISPRELLVGGGTTAWAIPLARVNGETVDIDGISRNPGETSLQIRIDDFEKVVLFSGKFCHLNGFEDLLLKLVFIIHGDEIDGIVDEHSESS